MDKNFQSAAIALFAVATMLAPASGFAYLAPECVFGDGTSCGSDQPAPPNEREGEAVIQQQQQVSAERRAAEQSQLQPVDAEPVDTYVPDNSPQPLNLLDPNTQYELRQERMANEKSSGPTIVIGGDATVTDGNGNVLHSGAPLVTSTGPESVLAIAAMILAAVSTFGYAQIRTRRMAAA